MGNDFCKKVYKVVERFAGLPVTNANEQKPLNELGIDSLMTLSLLMALQEEFGCEFDFDTVDFSTINSASGLAVYIETLKPS